LAASSSSSFSRIVTMADAPSQEVYVPGGDEGMWHGIGCFDPVMHLAMTFPTACQILGYFRLMLAVGPQLRRASVT